MLSVLGANGAGEFEPSRPNQGESAPTESAEVNGAAEARRARPHAVAHARLLAMALDWRSISRDCLPESRAQDQVWTPPHRQATASALLRGLGATPTAGSGDAAAGRGSASIAAVAQSLAERARALAEPDGVDMVERATRIVRDATALAAEVRRLARAVSGRAAGAWPSFGAEADAESDQFARLARALAKSFDAALDDADRDTAAAGAAAVARPPARDPQARTRFVRAALLDAQKMRSAPQADADADAKTDPAFTRRLEAALSAS